MQLNCETIRSNDGDYGHLMEMDGPNGMIEIIVWKSLFKTWNDGQVNE